MITGQRVMKSEVCRLGPCNVTVRRFHTDSKITKAQDFTDPRFKLRLQNVITF